MDAEQDISSLLASGGRATRRRRWALAGVVLIVVVVGALWARGQMSDPNVRYTTVPVVRSGFDVIVTATGTVEPTNLVEVSSELSGTIDEVRVDHNDLVEVGTVLAQLDTTTLEAQLNVSRAELQSSIANVARARATFDDAREKFQMSRDLQARGATALQSFLTVQAEFMRAQADFQSAEAHQALSQANLDLQQALLDKACICSPIEGIVLDRSVDTGQIVAATLSAPILFTIAEDLSQMELQVDVDEADIGRVQQGNQAEFTVDAYEGMRFPAEISEVRFAPQVIDGVVTYKAVLTIDNSDLLLRPGMTATSDIIVSSVADVLVVPNAALRYTPPVEPDPAETEGDERSGLLGMLIPAGPIEGEQADNRTLWVLRGDMPVEVTVKPGETNGRLTAIVEGDLAEGDLVITERFDG